MAKKKKFKPLSYFVNLSKRERKGKTPDELLALRKEKIKLKGE